MINSVNKYPINILFNPQSATYYRIPKYQREYTWSYAEWEALYDDLIENSEGYFIGSIIEINNGDSHLPILEVIDGQQRLTTISIFLAVIYSKLKSHKDELDEDQLGDLLNLKKSLLRSTSPNGMIVVPQVQNFNADDYSAVMADHGIIGFGTRQPFYGRRKINRCFNYFSYRIDNDLKQFISPEEYLRGLIGIMKKVQNAMVVIIEVNSHSDAYTLFESLNNRGTPLTAIDLMKNLIMARAEKAGLTCDECFARWQALLKYLTDDYKNQERFFRYYYNAFKTSLNKPFKKDDDKRKAPLGIVATKSNLLSIYEKLIERDLVEFLDKILEAGQLYSLFISPTKTETPTAFSESLEELGHIQGVPSYQLLLFLFSNKGILQIEDDTMNRIIKLLTVFFVHRNVTDFPATRDLNRIFMDIIDGIEEKGIKSTQIYQFIEDSLKDYCDDDELFKRRLMGDIYKTNVDAARFLLCALAQKAMTKETWTNLWKRTDNNLYVWTIEHIFPEGDNVPDCWVEMIAGGDRNLAKQYLQQYAHKFGNLTMTGYNSDLGNFSFEKKRDRKNKAGDKFIGYKNGLEINAELAEKENWSVSDIKDRTLRIVNELGRMFKFPGTGEWEDVKAEADNSENDGIEE